MPVAFVKRLAKKHGVSVSTAEGRWERAKSRAKEQGRNGDYGYITGIFKNMMGESSEEQLDEARKHFTDFDEWKEAAKKAGYHIKPSRSYPSIDFEAYDENGYHKGDMDKDAKNGFLYLKETKLVEISSSRTSHRFTDFKDWNEFAKKEGYTVRGPFVPSIGKKKHSYSATDKQGYVQGDFDVESNKGYMYTYKSKTIGEDMETPKKYEEELQLRRAQVRRIYKDLVKTQGKGKKEFIDHLVRELGMKPEQADFWYWDMTTPSWRDKPVSDKEEKRTKPVKHEADEPEEMTEESIESDFNPTFKEFLVLEKTEPETIKKLVAKAKKASYGKPLKD